MIPAFFARRVAIAHRWLGLIVGVQIIVWTATGLFFSLAPIETVRGDRLLRAPEQTTFRPDQIRISAAEALAATAEDRPYQLRLRPLGGELVWEVRAEIGVFLVSAATGEVLSPLSEDTARRIALAAYAGDGRLQTISYLERRPREAGSGGAVYVAAFGGADPARIYVDAATGEAGPARTRLWGVYDVLYGLHIMDYGQRERFNHPLLAAAAAAALALGLLGGILLTHRLARSLSRGDTRT
jgi:hypothetical protein